MNLLTAAAAPVSAQEAAALASERFGMSGEVRALTSERDQNFRLTASDGRRYTLKISHPAEDPAVCDFQTAALRHIAARDPALPVPRPVPALDGQWRVLLERPGCEPRIVRLLSYLEGEMLHQALPTAALRRSLGAAHARLGRALEGFSHPAEVHDLLWDIKQAGKLTELIVHLAPERRALPERALDIFLRHVEPALPSLRAQVIHNDLNAHNVVVEAANPEVVSGILDFGDMVRSPLVCDVAVAGSYLVRQGEGPLGGVQDYLAAYHAVSPLAEGELDVLFDMILTRLGMTALITNWRAKLFPENAPYILRNAPAAWAALERLAGISRGQGRDLIHAACNPRA